MLLDLHLSDTDALAAARQIGLLHPDTKAVIVADTNHLLLREAARSAGARGCVLKENLLDVRRLRAVTGDDESAARAAGLWRRVP